MYHMAEHKNQIKRYINHMTLHMNNRQHNSTQHRSQSLERRISVTLRSTEGELGDLVVTVVASLTPLKGAKVAYCTFHDWRRTDLISSLKYFN